MGWVRERSTGRVLTDITWIVENKSKSPPHPVTTEFMEHNQLDPVFNGTRPSLTPPYETIVDDGVEQVDGKWTTKYKVGPIYSDYTDKDGKTVTVETQTAAYIASVDAGVAEGNRNKRTALLAETDYFGLSDVTMSSNMKTYRQALRDLPKHSKWPHLADSDWPTKPS